MEQKEEFTPRPYQIDLYEKAIKGNTLIYLPTGSGKTYIVVMVIKKLSAEIRKPWHEGGKRTIFLVNTVPLVEQQCAYISRHSDLSCDGYTGDMNVDMWNADKWTTEFINNQVLVMTSQILLDILNHGILSLSRINLIIFDECHHAVGDHPMRLIMKTFEDYNVNLHPKVLGTSATLLNSNIKYSHVWRCIRDLEITFHAKIITVDSMTEVKSYGNPTENIYYYELPNESANEVLDSYIDHANKILDTVPLSEINLYQESSKEFQPRSKNLKLKCILENIREAYKKQGLYFTFKTVLSHIIQLEKIKKSMEDLQSILVMNFLITQLTIIRQLIANAMNGSSELENMMLYSCDQLNLLFTVLRDFYRDHTNQQNKFCCIIFVRRRNTANTLYQILKQRAQLDNCFRFLIPEYVVGASTTPYKNVYESLCTQKWNEEVLAKFRAGIVNCLVATDVLDEGIDIPKCSLVIRYDTPQDYRGYIQSKGRGRHKNSHYVMFSEKNSEFVQKYQTYCNVERTLSSSLVGNTDERIEPLIEHIQKNLYTSEIEKFSVTNSAGMQSVITEVSAISTVNLYCSKLSRSKFINCVPIWSLHRCTSSKIAETECYVVAITLPMISPLREKIYGDIMPSITLAKRSAAMKTCQKLYEIGELNDNLLPKNIEQITEDITSILCNWQVENAANAKVVGTTSNKRPHDIIHPEVLYGAFPTPNQNCYLHVIKTKPNYSIPTENRNLVFYNMFSDLAGYAILSTKKIPKIPSFPIFTNRGPLNTKLEVNFAKVELTSNEIMQLRQFHWVIFKEILECIKNFMIYDTTNSANNFLVVPVDEKYNIDWDIIRRYPSIRRETQQSHTLRAITNGTVAEVLDECGWQLVTPNYRSSTNIYVVTDICEELTPKSMFPTEDYTDYIHYFREKHQLYITDVNQPLLEVKSISSKINFLKPRTNEKSMNKRKRSDLEEHLIPELCYKVIFPAMYWLKATLLPTIIHRISQLLTAEELRRDIATQTQLGVIDLPGDDEWPPLEFQPFNNDENIDNFLQQENFDEINSLDNSKSDLVLTNPNIDIFALEHTRYPWSKEQEPFDIERNIDDVQLIDINYYHQWTKSLSNVEVQGIMRKYKKKIYTTNPNVLVPPLKVLNDTPSPLGPSPADIIPALTPKMANDAFNLERLETLGDSYLKFIASLYLFERNPNWSEGRLTSAKGVIIGNRNLYYCGKSKNIPGRLKVDEFDPSSNFIPPSYSTPKEIQEAVKLKNKSPNVLYEMTVPINEQFEGQLSVVSTLTYQEQIDAWVEAKNPTSVEQFIGFQFVPDKTVSDSVESLTGVYLNCMGLFAAAKLLKWFGVLPSEMNIDKVLYFPTPTARIGNGDIEKHIPWASFIENVIGYQFSDRSFLLQAFTHPSYTSNTVTASYDRLEFIGDAIIDFLITVYIYENCGDLTPGALTDLRSALVNNITFACLSVKYGLHTALLSYAPQLSNIIERFVKYQEERDHLINDELLWVLLEEDDCNMVEYVNVPKILGDLFESVIGAVYLDSRKNLVKVWEILYNLMHNEIQCFSKNVPKQPVRVIYETPGTFPIFLNPELVENSIMVPLEIQIHGERKLFHGFGMTKKQAKAAAAKQALKLLMRKT